MIVVGADLHEAAASDFGRGLLNHLERAGDGLLGWVVAVDDAWAVARRLGDGRDDDSAVRHARRRPLELPFVGDPAAERSGALRRVANRADQEIWQTNRKVYGARRVHAELRLGRGTNVSKKRVERLMREAHSPGSRMLAQGASFLGSDTISSQCRPRAYASA